MIRFGAEVTPIDQDRALGHRPLPDDGRAVLRHRRLRDLLDPVLGPPDVEAIKPFSREKQRAIRAAQLRSVDQDPVPGPTAPLGGARRHLRWRHRHRPAHPAHELPDAEPERPRGVLLASYTWGQDAARWGAMDEETRIEQALEDVAQIHPWIARSSRSARRTPGTTTRGPAARSRSSNPSQQTNLQADIVEPEGRVHFAGEHTSLYHAWIQGALESGIRAAREIHEAAVVMEPIADRRTLGLPTGSSPAP